MPINAANANSPIPTLKSVTIILNTPTTSKHPLAHKTICVKKKLANSCKGDHVHIEIFTVWSIIWV